MSHVFDYWQKLINQLPELRTGSLKQGTLKHFWQPGIILGLSIFVVAMLIWNWKLLLAIFVGIVVMLLAYSIPKWNWEINWSEIRRNLNSANSRLAIAGTSGIVATFFTYMAAVIWVESPTVWMGMGAIFQGCGTLLTLVLLVWQIFNFKFTQEEDDLQELLNNLTATDSLKRFLAVRQLHKMVANTKLLDIAVKKDITSCLQLLLSREEETVIRDVALESLESLDSLHLMKSNNLKPLPSLAKKMKQKEEMV